MIQIETIFDILVKGFIIGVVVSAPLGPVGVLCIQRTLNKGRWYGFVTGLGASLSDIAYALLTGYGMSFVFDYINKNIFYLQLLGSIMLLLFGIYTFRSNPVQSIRPASPETAQTPVRPCPRRPNPSIPARNNSSPAHSFSVRAPAIFHKYPDSAVLGAAYPHARDGSQYPLSLIHI